MFFVTKLISHSSGTDLINLEMEEFIDRLMSSKKFDEFAEKIADKAVQRIKSLDKVSNDMRKGLEDRVISDKRAHLNKQTEIIQNRAIDKITTKAFTYKDDSKPREQMLLQYKYLSQNVLKNPEILKKVENLRNKIKEVQTILPVSQPSNSHRKEITIIHQESNERLEESPEANMIKRNPVNKVKSDNLENVNISMKKRSSDQFDDSDSDKKIKSSGQVSEEKEIIKKVQENNSEVSPKNINGTFNMKNDGEISDIHEERVDIDNHFFHIVNKNKQKSFELNKRENTEESETEFTETAIPIEDITEGETKPLNDEKANKEDEYKFNDSSNLIKFTGNEENSLQSKENGQIEEISTENVKSTRKLRIRKEGNKVYTFQSSSDYEEYHENAAKLAEERDKVLKYK